MALVEPPQTRTEVVAIDAHLVTKSLVHLIENLRESHDIPSQAEEYLEGVQIRQSVLTGERLELRYLATNRVGCGMRDESENVVLDAYRESVHVHIFYTHIYKGLF